MCIQKKRIDMKMQRSTGDTICEYYLKNMIINIYLYTYVTNPGDKEG